MEGEQEIDSDLLYLAPVAIVMGVDAWWATGDLIAKWLTIFIAADGILLCVTVLAKRRMERQMREVSK